MIAIIPARGGSKGLPGKNIRKLNGIPLIGYTIKAAIEAEGVDRVIVTTDSASIREVANEYGAEIPFERPSELATDSSSAVDVYLHAVNHLINQEKVAINNFMVLLPTVPLRNAHHIDEAISIFSESHATTLISVKDADIPPSWYLEMDMDGRIHNAGFGANNGAMRNRQLDQGYYVPNGAIYILDYRLLSAQRTYYCENTIPYIMSRRDSVDIDTLEDFEFAEFIMSKKFDYGK